MYKHFQTAFWFDLSWPFKVIVGQEQKHKCIYDAMSHVLLTACAGEALKFQKGSKKKKRKERWRNCGLLHYLIQ